LFPSRARNLILLAASYVFYAFWDWRCLILISLSILVDFVAGLGMGAKLESAGQNAITGRKLWLYASLCFQLGVLGVFKYFNFFADSLYHISSLLPFNIPLYHLRIVLPIGISFYTLRTMTYVIEVYRGKIQPTSNLRDYALFVSFFPTLIAGPIERAQTLLPQIAAERHFDTGRFNEGMQLIFWGLFKKVYVADNLSVITGGIVKGPGVSGINVIILAYAYAFQIYADFSGYTDIARGCAKCLGFDLMRNFNYPYLAVNPSNFWQRWHISLSSWLRDYLFQPLGGALRGMPKAYRNLAITMFLAGLWHGASWPFVIWGVYQGCLMIGHRIMQPHLKQLGFPFRRALPRSMRNMVKIAFTFQLTCYGWLIFFSPSMSEVLKMTRALFNTTGVVDVQQVFLLAQFVGPLALIEMIGYWRSDDHVHRFFNLPGWTKAAAYASLLYMMALHGAAAQSFIYARF